MYTSIRSLYHIHLQRHTQKPYGFGGILPLSPPELRTIMLLFIMPFNKSFLFVGGLSVMELFSINLC